MNLTLNFGADSSLLETEFRNSHTGTVHRTSRGKTSGPFRGYGTFQWTNAVKALCVLSLITRASSVQSSSNLLPLLSGSTKSLASSLDYALSKEPLWIQDMFGADSTGRSTTRYLFSRSNSGLKRSGPVTIGFNLCRIQPNCIRILTEGMLMEDPDGLSRMAAIIS